MRELLRQYANLRLKDFLYRRRFRGPAEFSFRLRRGVPGRYRIEVAAREGGFRTTVSLRRGSSDLSSFVQVFGNNDYNLRRLARARGIYDLHARLAEEGLPLILDLGANAGFASLYFAKNFPKARIIAVEPEARNYGVLRDNLAGVAGAEALQAAVASEDGAVRIADPDAPAWAMRTEWAAGAAGAAGEAGAVAALSVPSLLRRAPANGLPFIAKIDVEGFESDLFAKNTGWVAQFPVLIVELHDWLLPRRRTAANFLRVIARQDRDFVCVGENVFSIANTGRLAAPGG